MSRSSSHGRTRISSNRASAPNRHPFTVLCSALVGVFFTVTSFASGGPGIRETTAIVRLQGDGIGTFTADFAFDESVPLSDVSIVHIDALFVQIFHSGAAFAIELELELLAGERVVQTLYSGDLYNGEGTQSATFRAAFTISPRFDVVDGLRVGLTNRLRDGAGGALNATTIVAALDPEDILTLRFVERAFEPSGPHTVRELRGVPQQTLSGTGVTVWREFTFDRPIPTENLRFVYHDGFGWGREDLDGGQMSESHLILETKGVEDRYIALDDALSPSVGIPAQPGNISGDHSLEIDDAARRAFGDRPIVGWRWRIHRAAGTSSTTFFPPDPLHFYFVYEFADCNRNNVSDAEEIAAGTASDCNQNGFPDACDPDCNANGRPDVCDLRDGESADCNENGLPDECDVVPPRVVALDTVEPISLDGAPTALVWADTIGDIPGYLAVADRAGDTVTIYHRRDDGVLEPSAEPPLAVNAPRFVLAGDLDGDGGADLIAVSSDEIVVFRNGGGFETATVVVVDGAPNDGELGDVDGDGLLDLVLAKRGADAVAVFINTFDSGTGRYFADETVYPAANAPFGVRLVDLDQDGDLDWLTVSANADGQDVTLALNRGDGSFDAPLIFPLGHRATAIGFVAADLDGDGSIELVTYDATRRRLITRSVQGDGFAAGERTVPVVATPVDLVAGDLNADGQLDIVTADGNAGSLSVYLGRRDCSFESAYGIGPFFGGLGLRRFIGGVLSQVAPADLDGNRATDLLAIDATQTAARIIRYDFHPISPDSPDCNRNTVPDACDIAAGLLTDADGDGLPDRCGIVFRRADANADGLLNIADAVFTLGFLFTGSETPTCLETADADDSGRIEITDPVYSLNFLFLGGTAPPAPHPGCGEDETEDRLGCDEYGSCV
jgi:hypothetical protein